MARGLFLVCLTGLICVAYCDSEDIGLTSLGKIMQIQEAMMGQTADRADSGVSGRTLGESDVASLEPTVKQMPDEDSMVARVHQQKLHQMVKLQKLIAGLKQSAEPDLGESDEQSPLEKLMNPTSDESDPISQVSSYLQGVDRVSPSEMSDLKRFYIDQTVKALHKLHGESHQIMQRYADKELRSLADDNLSFEGLSVGVQNGMDKSKSSFETMQACLAETSRLAKFLADIRKIKAHPWHDDWSSKDEAKAESLIRLHQSETEISDGIEELMARVDCNDAGSALVRLASHFNHSCIPMRSWNTSVSVHSCSLELMPKALRKLSERCWVDVTSRSGDEMCTWKHPYTFLS